MFQILIWIIVIALFLLSFVGIIYPLLPSVLVLWAGFLLFQFTLGEDELNVLFWVIISILTMILILSDIIANSYFVKKFGGSKWGERGAAVAVIIGSFIIPPLGAIVIPFGVVFIVEMFQEKSFKEAIIASIGSLIGFLSGACVKVVILIIMFIWFFVDVFL